MALNPRVAVYTGMFDPVHHGHVDIIRRGAALYDRLIVGVGINPEKHAFFEPAERVELLLAVCKRFKNVEVLPFSGLAVTFVRSLNAGIMLRGLRTLSDMEYEFNMSLTNQNLDDEIETVFLMAQVEHSHFSSTLIRQIGTFGGDLHPFVPPEVETAVVARAAERRNLNYRDER
ncbi:MAG: pantetheine-phosphate adenylyltransferase [Gemmataceae bacterium]|nr:pantetheine-phosphate adenylyltransferase [Gemmataceae bacterium]